MQWSHSRVELFENCPYRFKLRYLDKLEVLPSDDPTNALYLGTALHEGIEKGLEHGIQSYYKSYPIISDLHIHEAMKLEHWIPKVRDLVDNLTSEPIFEHKLDHPDMVGFMDLLVPLRTEGNFKYFALYDFKYSNHQDRYMRSRQLHEYKYFYEKLNPYHKIEKMGFIFIPKTQIRQKKTETLDQFRKRLRETLESMEISVKHVEYQSDKVIEFYSRIKSILEATDFPKRECGLCNFCEYKQYCQEGDSTMLLPKNERRVVTASSNKKIWLYGMPFSGKTTLADQFPDPIFLNTDGNLNSFTGAVVEIKDTLDGRQTVMAWQNFEAVVDEVVNSEFKTVVLDLVEDLYEHCRQFMYKELEITHESDNLKSWDMVAQRFLKQLKRLSTSGKNVVLISHEDTTKDIMKKSGDKITAIRPNIREKVANKLCGMMDIVARVVCDDNTRTLQFKTDNVVFGGGRLGVEGKVIPLSYEALMKIYEDRDAEMTPKVDSAPKTEEEAPRQRRRRAE